MFPTQIHHGRYYINKIVALNDHNNNTQSSEGPVFTIKVLWPILTDNNLKLREIYLCHAFAALIASARSCSVVRFHDE